MHTDSPSFLGARDLKVVSLVGVGHFASHFYFLVLPPLFPILRTVFDASYTELGFALAVMAMTSALVQTPVGFLVDRYGPSKFLITGVVLCGASVVGVGLFPRYDALIVCMVAFGVGDSVFHPADYAILNKTVDPGRMGRAFSVHTFAGHLGFAAAPVTVIALSEWLGWRGAVVVCGLAGIGLGALMFANRHLLGDRPPPERVERDQVQTRGPGGLSLLLSLPMLSGFVFYAAVAMTGQGMTGFGISALHMHFDLPLAEAGAAISAYLFAAPVGVLLAGWFADRTARHHMFVIVCFAILAAVVFTIAATTPTLVIVIALFAVAGFFIGAVNPARDMLIRSMVPPSQTGTAFGFVTVGLNAGGVVGPLMYGWLLDHAAPIAIFWAIGAMALLTIAVVIATARIQASALAPASNA